jgi:rhamnogalacturonyl hydrolase YesR
MLNIGGATPSRRLRATSHTRVRAAITAILATRADSGEVLHIRLRTGSANTSRGILRFTDELIARLDRAGATGPQAAARRFGGGVRRREADPDL